MDAQGSVLGIDVGWSVERRSSAVCRLSWDEHWVDWKIERFRATQSERESAICRVAGECELLAVAVDGPLRRGFDVIGRYRSAERLLSRGELWRRIGKPGQSSSPNGRKLNEQANAFAELVKRCCHVSAATHETCIDEHAIVEAFPTTFLGVMIECPDGKMTRRKRSDRYFEHLADCGRLDSFVSRLLGGRTWARAPAAITNHDDRAGIVCAITALSVAAGEFTAVGDEQDGWISLPPQWAFADWAWTALCRTAHSEKSSGEFTPTGELLSFLENSTCSSTSH